jgi:hypothetical protein
VEALSGLEELYSELVADVLPLRNAKGGSR